MKTGHTKTPYDDVLTRLSPGPQSMSGFDEDYPDIVAYIIRCTYKIWEEKQVGLIDSHYAEDAIIHTAAGDVTGAGSVLANTVSQLSMFPNRRLFPEDVIWTGNDEDGFYTSHRIRSTAHHLGNGLFGEPTGKRLIYRVIADCYVRENRIIEEWLVRDDLDIIRQVGLDEDAYVRLLVQKSPENYSTDSTGTSPKQLTINSLPPMPEKYREVESFIKSTWQDAWNRRRFDSFFSSYISTIHCHSASGRELFGHQDIIQFAMDWLACFPNGKMSFENFCAQGDDQFGYRTSLRWTFTGTHKGYGIYGKPSGRPVMIPGITQATVHSGKIIEEWTVFDELNLLCQIYTPSEPGGEVI